MATQFWQAVITTAADQAVTDEADAQRALAEATGDDELNLEDVDAQYGVWNIEIPDETMSKWMLRGGRHLDEVEVRSEQFVIVIPLES